MAPAPLVSRVTSSVDRLIRDADAAGVGVVITVQESPDSNQYYRVTPRGQDPALSAGMAHAAAQHGI